MDLHPKRCSVVYWNVVDGTDYVWGYAVFSEYNYYFRKRVSVMGHWSNCVRWEKSSIFWNSIGQRGMVM